jgi:hypothetical protein
MGIPLGMDEGPFGTRMGGPNELFNIGTQGAASGDYAKWQGIRTIYSSCQNPYANAAWVSRSTDDSPAQKGPPPRQVEILEPKLIYAPAIHDQIEQERQEINRRCSE